MRTYKEFHGDLPISDIGKELRRILKMEVHHFKVLTGYGSTTGSSKSKTMVLKSLSKLKKDALIQGYFPGEVKNEPLTSQSPYCEAKMQYGSLVKNDPDYGNDGIIFVFIKRNKGEI